LTTRAPTRNGNVIERCSGRLKGFRRIATRYHKLARRKLLSALGAGLIRPLKFEIMPLNEIGHR
jgi:hypothetical protein